MKTKYYKAEKFELQIINEGGCVANELCEPFSNLATALKAYKSRRLLKNEMATSFNLHHLGTGRPTETPGVEKSLVVLYENDEGEDCEMQLLSEFI